MKGTRNGYIFVETVVAMALLSVSALVMQGALQQAVHTRGHAQDYTTVRFLLEKIAADHALRFQQPEGTGAGRFEAPFDRFQFTWQLSRVNVPVPIIPPFLPLELMESVEREFHDYMGKLTVTITWQRAGMEFEAIGETLLRSELLWQPEEEPLL